MVPLPDDLNDETYLIKTMDLKYSQSKWSKDSLSCDYTPNNDISQLLEPSDAMFYSDCHPGVVVWAWADYICTQDSIFSLFLMTMMSPKE